MVKRLISAIEVVCPICLAEAHQPCLPISAKDWGADDHYLPSSWAPGLYHVQRILDADDATRALNALLGDDNERD